MRELNWTSLISLVTHNAKGEMRDMSDPARMQEYCQTVWIQIRPTFLSNSLDHDQARQNVRPDLDPNGLHRFPADDKLSLGGKRDKPVSEWDDLATPLAIDGLSTAGCGTQGHT